jgi:hypothetical protein
MSSTTYRRVALSVVVLLIAFSAGAASAGPKKPPKKHPKPQPVTFAVGTLPGEQGGEPTIARGPDGRLAISGLGDHLWTSSTGGASWNQFRPPTDGTLLAQNDEDAIFDSKGRLYFGDLSVASTEMSYSDDLGKTFQSAQMTAFENDRPWLANWGSKYIYLTYHDFAGEQPVMFLSPDRGDHWIFGGSMVVDPRYEVPSTENTNMARPVVDQRDGTVYQLVGYGTPEENAGYSVDHFKTPTVGGGCIQLDVFGCAVGTFLDNGQAGLEELPWGPIHNFYLARSAAPVGPISGDAAPLAFQNFPVLTTPDGAFLQNIFSSMAIDSAGNLYVAVTGWMSAGGPSYVWLTTSTDRGETWSTPTPVNPPDGLARSMGAITVTAPGQAAVAYYKASSGMKPDEGKDWTIDVATATDALSAQPHFSETQVMDGSVHPGPICTAGLACHGGRELSDFLSVTTAADGSLLLAFGGDPVENGQPTFHTYFARQTGGPRLTPPAGP